MKQRVTYTVSFVIDEEDENANYDYAKGIGCELYNIVRSDDYNARLDFDIV